MITLQPLKGNTAMKNIDQVVYTEILAEAIKKTQEFLLQKQDKTGFWVGELEADASVTAGYIPFIYFMSENMDADKRDRIINFIRLKQKDDGSWSSFHAGPGDLNVTVQVYFALKLAGISASEPCMLMARQFILSNGGVMKVNTITRIWLAMFGQYDYRGTPSIPLEIALLPNSFFFNIYEFASWSRETIMALMLILALKPVCKIPEKACIKELYLEPLEQRRYVVAKREGFFNVRNLFLDLDRLFKILENQPIKPLRNRAKRKVEKWVLEHQEKDGSWGGILLPWVYSLMALKSLGYTLENPIIEKGMDGLSPFLIGDANTLRMQPAVSPVWDTAWSALSLLESGLPISDPSIQRASKWLLQQEINSYGDWKIKNRKTEPGCWAFEFNNDFYPDIDDTSVTARLLFQTATDAQQSMQLAAANRGLKWVKKMQNKNGGWAAFDSNNNLQILSQVPYGDFMTPLDPTSPDVTAHAIELIAKTDPADVSLKRAIAYLKQVQEPDGSWFGRWGVNYMYGTGLVLLSLNVAGENMEQPYISQAADWLEANQNSDGGWGETCETYNNPDLKGKGQSTASQTAWCLMGLIACKRHLHPSVAKGILYFLKNQNDDGSWTEEAFTGTGFPKAFYLRYDLYRIYFPLLVLGQFKKTREDKNG